MDPSTRSWPGSGSRGKLGFVLSLLNAYKEYDPAARSRLEILLLYPGVKALGLYRLAHWLWNLGVPFLPRALSEFGRWLTGIEIHPAAKLGRDVIIDHGMGVVIGETAELGDRVIIYQGVTLGGTSLEKKKRHPTLGDGVVVGAGAKVLGNIFIGENSRIGANSVVVDPVPPYSTVVGIPGRIIAMGVKPGEELSHEKIKETPKS
jgi:serine O-acetyltransferase